MLWAIISLVLTFLFWRWVSNIIKAAFALGNRIAASNEASAASLAILIDAMTPEAKERVAAVAASRIEEVRQRAEAERRKRQAMDLPPSRMREQFKGARIPLGVFAVFAVILIGLIILGNSKAKAAEIHAGDRHADYSCIDGDRRAFVQWDEAAGVAVFHRFGSRVWIKDRIKNFVDEEGFIQFDFSNITFIEDYRSAATSGITVQGRHAGNVVWQYECEVESAAHE